MAEWLFEAGIGEDRAALVDDDVIIAARIDRHGDRLRVGFVGGARLVETPRNGKLGRVVTVGGEEAVLQAAPPGVTEGGFLLIEIVREAIAERGRPKRAVAVVTGEDPRAAPTLREQLESSDYPYRECWPHEPDALEAAGWSELLEEAATGEIAFADGKLRMTVTPAMTLFDVDGPGDAAALACSGARAAAAAIVRHGIAGSVGIDLPTLASKAERQAADAALDTALFEFDAGPYDRTATNGFGFVQIIRPRHRMSLPESLAADPALAAALALLRRLERDPQPVVDVPAAVLAKLQPYVAELARRTGRSCEFRSR
ncbi:MAG: ribonuclease [Pseudomonadota bacterium]